MNNHIKNIPLVLFVVLFVKCLFLKFTIYDVCVLAILSTIIVVFIRSVHNDEVIQIKNEISSLKQEINKYEEQVKAFNLKLFKNQINK